MVYLKAVVPSKSKRGKIYSSGRWVGQLTKTRRSYKAHILRNCSPLELTAISTLVASLNRG